MGWRYGRRLAHQDGNTAVVKAAKRPTAVHDWRERVGPITDEAVVAYFHGRATPQQNQVVDAYVSHSIRTASMRTIEAFMYDLAITLPTRRSTIGKAATSE